MNQELTPSAAPSGLVPASYAEKAMASLLQLHNELMDEKERRVELFRRLMEKEQAVAELNMYVKMLEEKLADRTVRKAPRPPPPPQRLVTLRPPRSKAAPPAPGCAAEVPAAGPVPQPRQAQVMPLRAVPRPPPPPPLRSAAAPRKRAASDGWKTW